MIEEVDLDGEAAVVVVVAKVRPTRGQRSRCSRCGRRCRGYDRGEGRRRWRTLDLGAVQAYLEADAPRVRCPDHGVVVAAVPWARGGARFTGSFEDSKSSVRGWQRMRRRLWRRNCCGSPGGR